MIILRTGRRSPYDRHDVLVTPLAVLVTGVLMTLLAVASVVYHQQQQATRNCVRASDAGFQDTRSYAEIERTCR